MEHQQQAWIVQKARSGQYLNSPCYYSNCGIIEDDNPENALVRACFIVGSSKVRIVPIQGEWSCN